MKQLVTKGIVLKRTDYGEADRIVTLLTPDYGKLSLMARGVRRPKSKLAGGIELFSVSQLTFIRGRGDLGTLISIRLQKYYNNIVKSIDRVQTGYDLIKILNRATEDETEPEYFKLMQQALIMLDDPAVELDLIRFWFGAQLLRLAGHSPNLLTDTKGQKLAADKSYNFDFDSVAFVEHSAGSFQADHIKFLRLSFADVQPQLLAQVQGSAELLPTVMPLVQTMLTSYIRI